MDRTFKALADPSRRQLLDQLNERNGQTLRELCAELDMARQSVTKHLEILAAANLVTTVRRGREKLHYLNPAPIGEIAERWIDRFDRRRAQALASLEHALEGTTVGRTEFVYVTYIDTAPERLWQALTDPELTLQYWGIGLASDWRVGSPIRTQWGPGLEFKDVGQVVLAAEPYRLLSYRWHNYQPEHAEIFGWTPERLAELQREKQSRVTFEIEPAGSAVQLTVTHDDFEPDSEMLKATSAGWPPLLSSLKTWLETGTALKLPQPQPQG
jgi:uncharacterized protein YndB with AHSA1/START domain/DNA-binding transcriptional ArsR family regulator